LRGRHQTTNAAVAIQLAEALRRRGFNISHDAIVRGLESVRHEGRLSNLVDSNSLVDGAHNPSAAKALRDYLDEFVEQPITLVFGAMRDKALGEMAAILFPRATNLVLTQPDNPRAASADYLRELAQDFVPTENTYVVPNVREALCKARMLAGNDGVVCVTGSLYLVGEVSAAADLTKHVAT
jgi:dihydrofolate synthase/folylpolyglutamate synthase